MGGGAVSLLDGTRCGGRGPGRPPHTRSATAEWPGQPRFPNRWRPAARYGLKRPMCGAAGKELRQAAVNIRERSCSSKGRFERWERSLVTLHHQWTGPMELFAPSWRVAGCRWRCSVNWWELRDPGAQSAARGPGEDLGTVLIETFGDRSTPSQGLQLGQESACRLPGGLQRKSPRASQDAARLVDADLTLAGPTIGSFRLESGRRGMLWARGADKDEALGLEPLVVTIQGPSAGGQGCLCSDGPVAQPAGSLHPRAGQLAPAFSHEGSVTSCR